MGNHLKNQQEIVEKIYRRYTDPEDADLMQMIEGMLHLLGERLNRNDIHFVAELIQNAEDAGRRWERPEVNLHFLIERKRIIAQNNGRPFDDEDVKAICRAAASSKSHAENQIGFMGIGFKSVFKITEAPEIYSNGYHFRIKRYIYPEWIDDIPQDLSDSGMESSFIFPLKPDVDVDDLAQEFDHLDPTMLLFLKKLKSIEIDNRVTNKIQVMELLPAENGLVTLDSFQGKQHWRIVSFPILDSGRKVCSDEREGHHEQLLKIACAVDKKGKFQRLNNARFFAFLPTDQKTGLGFHLQADFVPTASRENIDESSKCNQFLLRLAGRELVKQICVWRDDGEHDVDIYSLLPVENEVKGIANLVATEIRTQAAKEKLIFTRNTDWVLPSSAFRLAKKEYYALRDLLTADDLTHYYKRSTDFIHEEIRGRDLKVVEALGVGKFGLDDLCGILRDEEWLTQKPIDWFIRLFIFLYDIREDIEKNTLLDVLQTLPIIPVEGGRQSIIKSEETRQQPFLPLINEMENSYTLFQRQLTLVSQDLVTTINTRDDRKKIFKALKWLGVQQISPQWLIPDVILPVFQKNKWETLDPTLHFAYLDFTRRYWQTYEGTLKTDGKKKEARIQAGQILHFKSDSDQGYSPVSSLLLSKSYKRDDVLLNLLMDVPGLSFIDDCYAEQEKEARKQKIFDGPSWHEFLHKLGMLQRSDIERILELLDNKDWLVQRSLEWISDLFVFLDEQIPKIEKLQLGDKLKAMAIIPLEDGRRVSAQSSGIFLPLNDDGTEDSYDMFREHIRLVAKSLLDIANNRDDGKKIHHFLNWLEIQSFEPYSIICNVVLPIFENDQWVDLEAELHFAYLDFIRRYWREYRERARRSDDEEKAIERVRQVIRFQCQSAPDKYLPATELFLSNRYKPADDLESKLADIPGVEFVSDIYAEKEEEDRQSKTFWGPTWKDFFHELKITEHFNVVHIINNFVLPQFPNNSWETDEMGKQHIILVDFIRRHIDDYDNIFSLANKLWLASASKDGMSQFKRPRELYIPQIYGESDVAIAFGDLLADKYVSEKYLEYSTTEKDEAAHKTIKESWLKLFEKLKVRQYIPMIRRENIGERAYMGCGSNWTPHHVRYGTVSDLWNGSIIMLVKTFDTMQSNKQKVRRARSLLHMLDQNWDRVYESATSATYHWYYYKDKEKSIPSEFSQTLKKYAWIPTKANTLVKVGATLFDPQFKDLIGDPEQVCAESVHTLSLRQFLGIRSRFTLDDALNELQTERRRKTPNKQHIRALYKWLQDFLNEPYNSYSDRDCQSFNSEKYIYLPDTGDWVEANSCFWEPSHFEIVNRHRPALSRIYDGLRSFFVENLKVRKQAGVEDYLSILANEIGTGPISEQEFNDIFQLYQETEKGLQTDSEEILNAIRTYKDRSVWLCEDGALRSVTEVYINDNPQMYELFQSKVQCVWFPPDTPANTLENLIRKFMLNRLSDVKPKITNDKIVLADTSAERWTDYLQRLIPAIAQYIYTHNPTGLFRQILDAGILKKLYRLTPIMVEESIPVVYQLPHGETAVDTQSIYVDLGRESLYLTLNLSVDDTIISRELCRIIGANQEVQNFIDSLLPRLNGDSLGKYIKEKNLSNLPKDLQQQIQRWQTEPDIDVDENKTVPDPQASDASDQLIEEEGDDLQNSESNTLEIKEDEPNQIEIAPTTTDLLDVEEESSENVITTEDDNTHEADDIEQLEPAPISEDTLQNQREPVTDFDESTIGLAQDTEDFTPDYSSPVIDESQNPPFTGKTYPDVPLIHTDWDRLRQRYGNVVDKTTESLERSVEDEWDDEKTEPVSRQVTTVRFILSFMNVTQGYLSLTRDIRDMLENMGNPERLLCQLDDETKFDLYVDYEKRVVYNTENLQWFFAVNNIPAGGIVYLEHIHKYTFRLYYKQGDAPIRQIRCAELQSDGSVKYFYIESAEYPCEIAEFVFRADKRLEDTEALFAESVGKKSFFDTMIDVFEEFGPVLTFEQVFDIVSTIRMPAYSTIYNELQQRPCFQNLGSGQWRFEPERGFQKIPRQAEREEQYTKSIQQHVKEHLDNLQQILANNQDRYLLKKLEEYLWDFLIWVDNQTDETTRLSLKNQ